MKTLSPAAKAAFTALAGAFALCLMFAVPQIASAADWVSISSDDESTFYFDGASLKRDGDVVEVLLLWNFPEIQLTRRPIKPYLSATRLTRYDCRAGRRANVETTLYRGAMASGEVTEVYRTPEAQISFEWVNPVAPGGESMRRVCMAAR
jgi:surface-adhesin protein E